VPVSASAQDRAFGARVSERQQAALAPPPERLPGFPRWSLSTDRPIYRAHTSGSSPWWFASGPHGRFDLDEPRGTCYLAATPETAARERWGRALVAQQVVMASDADATVVSALRVPRRSSLADARSARAIMFGVTREISTLVPYDVPRSWAAAFDAAGAQGVRYDARFSTAPKAVAYALFGAAGHADWPVDPYPAEGRLVASAAGIVVATVPHLDDLTIATPPVD
jgi:hypothetical protein